MDVHACFKKEYSKRTTQFSTVFGILTSKSHAVLLLTSTLDLLALPICHVICAHAHATYLLASLAPFDPPKYNSYKTSKFETVFSLKSFLLYYGSICEATVG